MAVRGTASVNSTLAHTIRLGAATVLSSVLPYTSYELTEPEYLGSYEGTLGDFRDDLRARGYHYQLFAATKEHPSRDRLDDGSYARTPDEHPDAVADTALAGVDPAECQYHVHPFTVGNEIEVYGHYEIHPYPWRPTWNIRRPFPRHYRPTWDTADEPRKTWTYLRGVRDSRLNDVLTNTR